MLEFMTNNPETNEFDQQLVRSIVTGRVAKHPAIQGVLVGCMQKLRNLEEGKTTMRSSKRFLLFFRGFWRFWIEDVWIMLLCWKGLFLNLRSLQGSTVSFRLWGNHSRPINADTSLSWIEFVYVWAEINWGDETERQLLIAAGAEMAASGCNHAALEFFGLQWIHRNNFRGCLSKMPSLGLPTHTAPGPEDLAANDHLVSSLFGKAPGTCQRRLVMAFDRTYIQQCSQFASTTRGSVMLGGCHRPDQFDAADESQMVLKDAEGNLSEVSLKKKRTLAADMEACVCWDPTRLRSPTLELAAYPCSSAAARDARFEDTVENPRNRGNWETLHRIGAVLAQCPSIRHVIADAHGAHKMVSNWMHGLLNQVALPDELKSMVPYFNTLTFRDLPACCFPIPIRIAYQENEPVFFWPGVAHSQKNYVSQLRSPLGTPHFGHYYSDASASLELGLFPCAYLGSDTMSDRQSALWFPAVVFSIFFIIFFFRDCWSTSLKTR